MRKVMDGSPLTHKVANGCQAVIQGQGRVHQTWVTEGGTACSVKGLLKTTRVRYTYDYIWTLIFYVVIQFYCCCM